MLVPELGYAARPSCLTPSSHLQHSGIDAYRNRLHSSVHRSEATYTMYVLYDNMYKGYGYMYLVLLHTR